MRAPPGVTADSAEGQAAGVAQPAELSDYHQRTREAAEQVLASPEFAGMREGPHAFEQFMGWLFDLFADLLQFIADLPGWLWWLVVIWMVATLVAILAHLVWVLVQTAGGTSSGGLGQTTQPTRRGKMFDVQVLDGKTVQTRAEQLLQRGDWAAAARHLYVAALLWLDGVGRVSFHQSKTNRDYLRELADRPHLADRFEKLTGLFEPIAYGGREADRALCEQMHTNVEGIRHEVAAPSSR